MSNHRKKGRRTGPNGRSVGTEQFVMLPKYMLECPAYRNLSSKARALYVEIKRYYNGNNNGDVFMSIRMAARLINVSPGTATKALDELQNTGFIRSHVLGGFNRKIRHATTWVLTEYEYHNANATKDFMRWHLRNQNQNTVSNSEISVSENIQQR